MHRLALLLASAILSIPGSIEAQVCTSPPELITQTGHSDSVNAIAFAPSGKWLATAAQEVIIWDYATRIQLRTFHVVPRRPIHILAISPDSKFIGIISQDGQSEVWNVINGQMFAEFRADGTASSMAFNSDGTLLAEGSSAGVTIWALPSASRVKYLPPPLAEGVTDLAFLPNSGLLAFTVNSQTFHGIRLVDPKNWTVAGDLTDLEGNPNDGPTGPSQLGPATPGSHSKTPPVKLENGSITTLSVTSDGERLAAASQEGVITLWNVSSRQVIKIFDGYNPHIDLSGGHEAAIVIDPAGEWIAFRGYTYGHLGEASDSISFYNLSGDVESGLNPDRISIPTVQSLAVSPNGSIVGVATASGVRLYETNSQQESGRMEAGSDTVTAVEISGNYRFLAFGTSVEHITEETTEQERYGTDYYPLHVWDLDSGEEEERRDSIFEIKSLQFANQSLLVTPEFDTPFSYELKSGKEFEFQKMSRTISNSSASNDAKLMAVVIDEPDQYCKQLQSDIRCAPGTVSIFDVRTHKIKYLISPRSKAVVSAFSPRTHTVAVGSINGEITLWDGNESAPTMLLKPILSTGWKEPISLLSYTEDGSMLIASNIEGTVIWDTRDWQEKQRLRGAEVTAVSPDGRLIAFGDTKIELVDTIAGTAIEIPLSQRQVRVMRFAPNTLFLLVGTWDGTLEVVDLNQRTVVASLVALRSWKESLVINSDGYFDGSPAAWNRVRWRFCGSTFDTSAVDIGFKNYLHPGLLHDALKGTIVKPAQNLAELDRGQPKVAFNSGLSDIIVDHDKITVTLTISEVGPTSLHPIGSGVRDVRLFRNNTLIRYWPGDLKLTNGKTTLTTSVNLVDGDNVLRAYAFNRDDIKSQDRFLRIPARLLKRPRHLYIVAVGVNSYTNNSFDLKFAKPDATQFLEKIANEQQKLKLYDHVVGVSLTDKDATKYNILSVLKHLAGDSNLLLTGISAVDQLGEIRPEDGLIFFFAGHGIADKGHFYLIPHDMGYGGPRMDIDLAGREILRSNGISEIELEQAFRGIDAGTLILIVDSCHAGQALEAEEKRRGPINSRGLAQLAYEKGIYVLAAAQSYDVANESASLGGGHGFLTFSLLGDGLTTKADRDGDGYIDVQEWLKFAVQDVPYLQLKLERNASNDIRDFAFQAAGANGERAGLQVPRIYYRRDDTQRYPKIARAERKN
jgi:WD40 repeat protein